MKILISYVIYFILIINISYAQIIEDWGIIWSGDSISLSPYELKAFDSTHFGFIASKSTKRSRLVLTMDGGKTWRVAYKSIPHDTLSLEIRDWTYSTDKIIYFLADSCVFKGWDEYGLNEVYDYRAYIFKSTDGGISWEKIQINDKWRSRMSTVLSMSDSLHGIMLQFPSKYEPEESGDQIWFTNDGWKTKVKISTPSELKANRQALYVYPKTIIVRCYGYERIFISTDLGNSWIRKDIPDSIKPYTDADHFKFYNANTFFFIGNKLISGDEGYQGYHSVIFKSTDSGDTWNTIYDKKEWEGVVDISIVNDSTIYTHGHKPRYTTNNGKDWIPKNNAYISNYEAYLSNIIEFSESNKLARGVYWILRYNGRKTLKPPYIVYPKRTIDAPIDFELKWTRVIGAERYHLQVVEREGVRFDNPRPPASFDTTLFIDDSTIVDTTYKLTGTSYYKEYTCRLRAIGNNISSPWLASPGFTTIKKVTGVSEEICSKDCIINPNPAYDLITIRVNAGDGLSLTNLSIIDVLGNLLRTYQVKRVEDENMEIQADVSDLSPGVYFARLTLGSKVKIAKFIKTE